MSRPGSPSLLAFLRGLFPGSRVSEESPDPVAEPQRLVLMDQVNDPNLRWGVGLIRRVGPVVPSRAMQSRVRLELDSQESPLHRRIRLVRWAPLAALFLAAGAGATVGRDWLGAMVGGERSNQTEASPVLPSLSLPSSPRPSPLGTSPGGDAAEATALEEPPSATVATNGKEPLTSRPKTATPAAANTPPVLQTSRPAEVTNLGSQLIVDALQARRAKRFTEVSRLTQKYVTQYPRGPLVEEALGLAMEAAANTRSGQRQVLAQRYLDRFPNGRFQGTAQRILQAP